VSQRCALDKLEAAVKGMYTFPSEEIDMAPWVAKVAVLVTPGAPGLQYQTSGCVGFKCASSALSVL